MTHRAVIEAGPTAIRRLCCGAAESTDAVEWIDDPVALVDGRPVAVPQLLRDVLTCPEGADAVEIIHPSWWPARRVDLIAAAARGVGGDIVTRSRARLLSETCRAAVIVEIAAGLVAVTATGTVAEPRLGPPGEVAAAVAERIEAACPDATGPVVIDAPAAVGGATALATMIAQRLRPEIEAVVIEELPISWDIEPVAAPGPAAARVRSGVRRLPLAMAAALGVVAVGLCAQHDPPPRPGTPTTYLVEGRVAVQVPADWPVRRMTGGPGSARVEVRSPTDPQLAVHVTQAPALGDTLAAVAEPLQHALQLADAETPGVFVVFDPAGSSAGRPAVTYREVRDGHHVDWAVLVDGAIRIGIGCQSGPGGDDALRPVCEQAVRSAHAVR